MSSIKQQTEREKLPAEVKFDKWVYGGISYAAQAFTGSALAYWIKHAGGRPIYDKIANWMGPNFISKITSKTGHDAIKTADSWITVTTMVIVGTLFVAPVKWLEDKKIGIVERWTNEENAAREARGETIAPEEKQHQQELLDQLKCEPRQTWWSLMKARAASLVFVYTAVPLMDKLEANQAMEAAFQKGTKAVAKGMGLKKIAESEGFKNASGIAFYDGFYSMISAGGLYVYSHFIAPPKDIPAAQKTLPEILDEKEHAGHGHATTHHQNHFIQKHTNFTESVMNSKSPELSQMAI